MEKKNKVVRWSFEPSKETIAAYQRFLESMGQNGKYVNKSRLIDALLLDGLNRETIGNKTGRRNT